VTLFFYRSFDALTDHKISHYPKAHRGRMSCPVPSASQRKSWRNCMRILSGLRHPSTGPLKESDCRHLVFLSAIRVDMKDDIGRCLSKCSHQCCGAGARNRKKQHTWMETFPISAPPSTMMSNIAKLAVLRSRSRKEPHLLVGAGAGTRCGSCSGSDNGINMGRN
jgi:hypothetical protein